LLDVAGIVISSLIVVVNASGLFAGFVLLLVTIATGRRIPTPRVVPAGMTVPAVKSCPGGNRYRTVAPFNRVFARIIPPFTVRSAGRFTSAANVIESPAARTVPVVFGADRDLVSTDVVAVGRVRVVPLISKGRINPGNNCVPT